MGSGENLGGQEGSLFSSFSGHFLSIAARVGKGNGAKARYGREATWSMRERGI